MAFKVSMLIQGTLSGWSDTFYNGATSLTVMKTLTQRLIPLRAGLLASQFNVIGYRITAYPSGQAQLAGGLAVPGVGDGEVSPLSISFRLFGSPGTARSWYARGVPDNVVVLGAYVDAGGFGRRAGAFIRELIASGWGLNAIVKTNVPARLLNISTTGFYNTVDSLTVAPDDFVKVMRARDLSGKRMPPYNRVVSSSSGFAGQIEVPAGFAGLNGGKIRKYFKSVDPFTEGVIDGVGTRKVGRPFELARGRLRRAAAVLIR